MYVPSDEVDFSHKVVMLGSSGVGKTSMVLRLQEKVFKKMITPTVGSGVFTKENETENGKVSLKIWDTAGEERYKTFTGLYSRSAAAGIIVYDTSDEKTFKNLDQWLIEFKENALESAPMFLVGNKIDLSDEREVPIEEGRKFASENKMKFYEVSAKTGENIELLFMDIAKELRPKYLQTDTMVDNVPEPPPTSRCC